jgi:hypothetical protein
MVAKARPGNLAVTAIDTGQNSQLNKVGSVLLDQTIGVLSRAVARPDANDVLLR